jgi:hypothetical protein
MSPTPALPPFSLRGTTPVQHASSCLSSDVDQNLRLPKCARISRRDHQKVRHCRMLPPVTCWQLPVTCARAFALFDTSLQRHGLFTRRKCREASHGARQSLGTYIPTACRRPRKLSALALSHLTPVPSNAFWRLLVVMVILIHVGKGYGFPNCPSPPPCTRSFTNECLRRGR